jgi:hypothetical protein
MFLLNNRLRVPLVNEARVSQLVVPRGHPGGGSKGHRRPKAEEAGARGIPPPTKKFLFF